MSKIYDFKIKNISGEIVDFSKYVGKTILIVNVASKCGFSSQYLGLEKLYKDYKEQGLVVLGFPCMQFKNQEFENDGAIKEFCSIKYNVTFEIFSRIDVIGKNQHPLYKFLTNSFPQKSNDVKWNFEKFLVNKEGIVVNRFSSITRPTKIEKWIKEIL
ncbi:MAG: glutathione peroxidase [Mycoplasmataceae bacterium]|nr:glutathione peroxidase [Mycoplasmataceae bacterium]